MGLPTVTQTWTVSANNRYTFTTVLGAMQNYALSLKNFLKTTMGYTVKGSCTAGTGAMDGVDRWSVSTDVTPRATVAAASQAWFVLTDGNGVDFLMAFQGNSDDQFRFSFSPSGVYVAAGTANNQPTATDECLMVASTTIVNSTASLDRVWHMWGSADKKMFRASLFRSSTCISFIGVEKVTSSVLAPATFSPAVWGYCWQTMQLGFFTGSLMSAPGGAASGQCGVAKVHTNQDVFLQLGGGGEMFGNVGGAAGNFFNVEKPELQGSQGELLIPLTVCSNTAAGQGKLGNRIDWWAAVTNSNAVPANGDTFGTLQFMSIGQSVLPWDGVTTPVVS